jgi:CIC family chloride channel protein
LFAIVISSLLAGAAAGLAAAFNTPLFCNHFVLEEVIEDLNSTRFLAQVLIASVTSTFIAHLFLGDDPAFVIPPFARVTWQLYLLVIPIAAAAGLVAVIFQRFTLAWRDQIKAIQTIPAFLRPTAGAVIFALPG